MNTFNYYLPYETLLNIFKFVSDKDLIESVRLVCWDFNEVVKFNILWKPRMKKWKLKNYNINDYVASSYEQKADIVQKGKTKEKNLNISFENYLNIYLEWKQFEKKIGNNKIIIFYNNCVINSNHRQVNFPTHKLLSWVDENEKKLEKERIEREAMIEKYSREIYSTCDININMDHIYSYIIQGREVITNQYTEENQNQNIQTKKKRKIISTKKYLQQFDKKRNNFKYKNQNNYKNKTKFKRNYR